MIDILAIRDRLNREPFVNGRRQVLIGRLSVETGSLQLIGRETESDELGEIPADAVGDYLGNLELELRQQHLDLTRGQADANELYAAQSLRREPRHDLTWMRDAVNWSARITTIALSMVVPGVVGLWLDQRFNTRFLGPFGFLLGIAVAIRQLLQLTR